MPKEFTGDGDGVPPPLEWSGAPAGTRSYALIMHHTNHGETMSYWIVYNIPADVRSLPRDMKGIGSLGVSSRGNHAGYSPPHSKGPGARTYVFTVYALSAPPQFSGAASAVTSEALVAAMKDRILASADLSVSYTRYTVDGAGEGSAPGSDRNAAQPPARRDAQVAEGGGRPAQGEGQGPGGGAGGGGGQRPVSPLFVALDLNGDGSIDAGELAQAAQSLKKADRNGDAKLTADEYMPQRPGAPGGQGGSGGGERPARMGNQDGGQRPGGGGGQGMGGEGQRRPGGGGGGGGRIAENNKTPASPNPGQTVGVFLNTPQAFAGYTLLAPKHNTNTYLIDNLGQVVHQWTSAYYPGQSVYLKPNGNLLHTCMTRNRSFTGGGEGGRIEEYDWNGKLVWEFWFSNDKQQQHHDIAPLPNGNILMLVVEKKSAADCVAAGFPAETAGELYPDSVVEIQPVYPDRGKVVWEWRVWDHLVQEFDQTKANYGEIAAHPELIAIRGGRGGPNGFWNHANSIAYNAKLDQIVVSARGQSEIWFIDHSTTASEALGHAGGKHGKGGDLIYRWGNPATYNRGSPQDAQLNQQHDAEWIPDGYPGAGHVTIFNNGYNRGYTSIEEIVPPLDADGHYVLEAGKPYGPEKPCWHYEAKNRTDFFSSEISGAHRLPNGDTLICAGVIGHLFEVSAAGETVWQYVNPAVRGGVLAQGEIPGKDVRGHLFNAVFKAHRYAPDHPGLKGRDLTPKGVIELPAAQKGKTGLDRADATPGERPPDVGGRGGQGGGGNGPGRQGGPGGSGGRQGDNIRR